jgi:hypothetical protein
MNTYKNLPLYTMAIDGSLTSEAGVEFVALVDSPAIQKGWLAFRQTPPRLAFKISEERRIISGPLMLADTPIFRQPPEVEEPCYVTFPPATIELIARKFFSLGNQTNVNIMHDDGQKVDGLVMYESFLTDSARGILPMQGYEDAPEGSWFGSFYVDNAAVWSDIKAGKFTGFSVEGAFAMLIPNEAPTAQPGGDWWNDPALAMSDEEREAVGELVKELKNFER